MKTASMKFVKWLGIILLVLIIVYFLGPRPTPPLYTHELPALPAVTGLDSFVAATEATHRLKPDNVARIIWANDSLKQPTEYAVVYLQGFSASRPG
jgi:hypothetical protein